MISASSEKPDELFFATKSQITQENIVLEGQEAIHCSKVLRKKVTDIIWICDGDYSHYKVEIQQIGKQQVFTKILETVRFDKNKTQDYPILVIGKLKNKDRLEWLIEKAVELGISEIHLVQTDRTERSYLKVERLEAIAIAAMKQSKQVFIPKIVDSDSLMQTLKLFEGKLPILLAHEKSTATNKVAVFLKKKCVLLIGPEGGFSDSEFDELLELQNCHAISLGEWRLRAETAAIHLVSLCSFFRNQ